MFRKNGIRGVFILTVVTLMMMAFAPVSGANEPLIVNGDFEGGNTGFASQYTYVAEATSDGMQAENTYAIGYDPADYHRDWESFGDHSNRHGMMMIVNGSPYEGNPTLVWGQEVNLPAMFSDAFTYRMFANVDWEVGEVRVKNSADEICVEFVVTEGWLITKAHVAIGDIPGDIPQKKGIPNPGKFEINESLKPGVTDTGWYCQPYDEEPIVAAHAELVRPKTTTEPRESATGWGAVNVGEELFNHESPATYITHNPQDPIAAMYRFTMWGASSYWQNPAVLEVNFGEISVGTATLTLPEDEGEWVKVEYDFNVSPTDTIYIAIRDRISERYGDDFVIDDISLELLP